MAEKQPFVWEEEYDVLLTNRLILQPSYEVNFYSQDDESRGRGRGLTDTEAQGLRLRYEKYAVVALYRRFTESSFTGKHPIWRKRR